MSGVANKVKNVLNAQGQGIALRRYSSSYNPETGENVQAAIDTPCTAVIKDIELRKIAGALKQGDKEVRIAAAIIPGIIPQAEADRIVIGGREFAIIDVRTDSLKGVNILHTLTIRG